VTMTVLASVPWWYWLGWFVLGLALLTMIVLALEAHRRVGVLRKQVEQMQSQVDRVEARQLSGATPS
jgi:cell division protein FtsW (lipid II flippase)